MKYDGIGMAKQKWYKNCSIAFKRVKVPMYMCSRVNREKAREKDNATKGKRSKRVEAWSKMSKSRSKENRSRRDYQETHHAIKIIKSLRHQASNVIDSARAYSLFASSSLHRRWETVRRRASFYFCDKDGTRNSRPTPFAAGVSEIAKIALSSFSWWRKFSHVRHAQAFQGCCVSQGGEPTLLWILIGSVNDTLRGR